MPSKASSSLAAQLAELGNAAPTLYDVDLENDAETLDAVRISKIGKRRGDESEEEDEEDLARNHARHNLQDVQRSKLRTKANFFESIDDDFMDKYRGVKATRKEMMGEDGEDDNESEDDESEIEENEEENSESEGYEGDEFDFVGGNGSPGESDSEEEESDDDNNYSSNEEESSAENDGTPERKETKKKLRFAEEEESDDQELSSKRNEKVDAAKAAQADAALLAELKQRSVEDAQRGRDARRQIDAWGKLLGCRIRAQKVVRSAGRISSQAMASFITQLDEDGEDKIALDATLNALDEISAHLFESQKKLLSSYASTSESGMVREALDEWKNDFDRPLKRKANEDDSLNNQRSSLLALHANVYGPMWKDVLAKWSWRTSNPTAEDKRKAKSKFDGAGNGSGLKAIEQSAEEQIRRGMSGDAYERLSKRTRVWRGNENETRIQMATEAEDEGEESDNPTANSMEKSDVFDDSDFYAALLRELIDNKGGLSTADAEGSSASAAWAQAAKRAAKKHRAVDRKASKGRRLRYDVHEKVQSFMPPIPRETWSEEQIDRLMRQLRSIYGNGAKVVDEDGDQQVQNSIEEEEEPRNSEVALNGLRLFG